MTFSVSAMIKSLVPHFNPPAMAEKPCDPRTAERFSDSFVGVMEPFLHELNERLVAEGLHWAMSTRDDGVELELQDRANRLMAVQTPHGINYTATLRLQIGDGSVLLANYINEHEDYHYAIGTRKAFCKSLDDCADAARECLVRLSVLPYTGTFQNATFSPHPA